MGGILPFRNRVITGSILQPMTRKNVDQQWRSVWRNMVPPDTPLVMSYIDSALQENEFNDDASVPCIKDFSGFGTSWVSTIPGTVENPKFKKGVVNGYPAFRFDGVKQGAAMYKRDILTRMNAVTLVVAWCCRKLPAAGTEGSIFVVSTASLGTSRFLVRLWSSGAVEVGGRRNDGDGYAAAVELLTKVATDQWMVHSFEWDVANADVFTYLNGSSDGTNLNFQTAGAFPATYSNDTPSIGYRLNPATYWAQIDVMGLVVFPYLNADVRKLFENMFRTRLGL